MAIKHNTTVWLVRQGVRLAWAMARSAGRLESAGELLEAGLDDVAAARGIDMLDVLEPLAPLSVA